MGSWLKLGYFTAAPEADPHYWLERTWVGDSPGRSSSRWRHRRPPRRGKSYPPFGPRYAVGDRLVVYIAGRGVCPAILEVVGEPTWDPDRVDAESKRGEGARWGVVTPVRGIHAVPLDDAPDLQAIGVSASSVQRQGHIEIQDWQYAEAERLIGRRPERRRTSHHGRTSADIPIEAGEVEGYDVAPPAAVRRAIRRESRLVRDYSAFLQAHGDNISRKKLRPPGTQHDLYSDLFNKTRVQLVEAKAGATRNDIRMAIGQLADYARFVPKRVRRAVLLEAKPHPDLLELLQSQGIAAIWRASGGFADNAGGAFT